MAYSITAGNSSGYFAINSSTGEITLHASGVGNLSGSYILTRHDDSANTDQQITVNIIANTYTVDSQSSYDAVISISTATLSGKTMAVRPNVSIVNADTDLKNRSFSSVFTIKSVDPENKALFDRVWLENITDVTIDGLEIHHPSDNAKGRIDINGTAGDIIIKNCKVHSIDPTGWDYAASGSPWHSTSNGVTMNNSIACDSITIEDNEFYHLGSGIGPKAANIVVVGNYVHDVYSVGIQTSRNASADASDSIAINYNLVTDIISLSSDYGSPHQDHIYIGGSNQSVELDNLVIVGNVCAKTATGRGNPQGIFFSGWVAGYPVNNPVIFGNLVVANSNYAIALNHYRDALIACNTVIEDYPAGSLHASIRICDTNYGGVLRAANNASDNFSLVAGTSGVDYELVNNSTLGNRGATIAYSTVFDGPSFTGLEALDYLSAYHNKSGGALDTASPKRGAVGSAAVTFPTSWPGHAGASYDLASFDPIPVITSHTGTETGETTADGSLFTDIPNGTLYWGAWPSASPPADAAAIIAGTGADWHNGGVTVTASKTQTCSATGLPDSTAMKFYAVHQDTHGHNSTLSESTEFTTDAPSYSETWVTFDGTNDWLTRTSDFSSTTDAKKILLFAATKGKAVDANQRNLYAIGSTILRLADTESVRKVCKNSGGTTILDASSANSIIQSRTTLILISIDMTLSSYPLKMSIWANGSWTDYTTITPTTFVQDGVIDLTVSGTGFSAKFVCAGANGANPYLGDVARFQLFRFDDGDTIPDVTDSAVKALFANASTGALVDPAGARAAYTGGVIDLDGGALSTGANAAGIGDFTPVFG